MSSLLFTKSHKVQQFDGNGPLYEAGKVYEFNGFSAETYAAKYKRLGLAVDAPETATVAPRSDTAFVPLEERQPDPVVAELAKPFFDAAKRRGRPPKNA